MKCVKIIGCCFLVSALSLRLRAQSYEVQQLLLDVTKLSQFKTILKQMEEGYAVLTQGYGQVKELTRGTFSLHKAFLDGLYLVSPAVRQYGRVADILSAEGSIVSAYGSAYARFKSSGYFSVAELDYMGRVYGQLTKAALGNLEQLNDVMTANKLRMSDEERLSAIDRIWCDTSEQLTFLRAFNNRTGLMQADRQRESAELQTLKNILDHE